MKSRVDCSRECLKHRKRRPADWGKRIEEGKKKEDIIGRMGA